MSTSSNSTASSSSSLRLTISHHLGVEITLLGGIVLLLYTIKMLGDVSGLAVDLRVHSVRDSHLVVVVTPTK